MLKMFLLSLPFFLGSCTYGKKPEIQCKDYKVENKRVASKSNDEDINIQTLDIRSFVAEHSLFLEYNFKTMSERYKRLKSTYLNFKVLESLSSNNGYDDGTLFNDSLKESDSHHSELAVNITGMGPNTNFYTSMNSVPVNEKLINNISLTIQDQIFIIKGERFDLAIINNFVKDFYDKGECLVDQDLDRIISEENFENIHIILESRPQNFKSASTKNVFSYDVYFTAKTDKKYSESFYW